MTFADRVLAFDDVSRAVVGALAPEERLHLAAVHLVVAPRPGARDLARGARPTDLGYFYGTAAGERDGTGLPCEAARGVIVCFLLNLEPFSAGGAARVLRHELGHALGQLEADLVWDDLATGADAW